MDPNFSQNFTKVSASGSGFSHTQKTSHVVNINFVLSFLIFIVVLIISAGSWGYSTFLEKQIEAGKRTIIDSREQYKIEVVQELIAFKDQIDGTRRILLNRMPSNTILGIFEQNLVGGIIVDGITISRDGGNTYNLTLNANTLSLNEYIAQTIVFRDSPELSSGKLTLNDIDIDSADFIFEATSTGLLTPEAQRLSTPNIEQ